MDPEPLRKQNNWVLFSFEEVDGVFMDYRLWDDLVMHFELTMEQDGENVKNQMFESSWQKSKWLENAAQHPGTVQLVTPSLNLPDAKLVSVRNKETKEKLKSLGFSNVEVRIVRSAYSPDY